MSYMHSKSLYSQYEEVLNELDENKKLLKETNNLVKSLNKTIESLNETIEQLKKTNEEQAKEILRLKKLSIEYLAKHTNKSTEQVAEDMERDFFMSAQDAKEYGIIDHIMPSKK